MSQQEREYYRADDVLVTNARAEMGGRTFAMANVTAVSMGTGRNPRQGCASALLAIGGVIAFTGLLAIGKGGGGWLVVGLVMFVAACMWWNTLKPVYTVDISSASGESRALQSYDREKIEPIVAAIKQAMIDRG
jgi:hypothetical protein